MSELTSEALAVIRARVAPQRLSWRDAVAAAQALAAEYPGAEIGAWERRGGFGLAARLGSETVAGSIEEVREWLADQQASRDGQAAPGEQKGNPT